MIRYGLAGLGVHGMRYARHLLAGDVPGARLAAVCRRDEAAGRELAEQHGVRYLADVAQLARQVDAVILVLPPDRHPQAALACLDAGTPVLVEKPLASDAASARKVAHAVARTGVPLMVAHTLRFDAVVRSLRDEIEGLGALRMIAINQRFEPLHRSWIDTPGPGGILVNTAVHGFDLLRFLSGSEPVSVQAETGRAVSERTEDQLAAVVRLEPGGILATLDNSRATAGRSGRIEVAGERGQVTGDHVLRTLRRVRGRDEIELGPLPDSPTVPAVLRHFTECLEQRRTPEVTVADGVAAVEMLEAARRSAETGRRTRLDEIRAG